MDAANPFAQPPLTPEPIIAQVARQIRAEAGASADALLDGTVERVVRDLWDSRVKTFVPILALREVRDQLGGHRQGDAGSSRTSLDERRPAPGVEHVPAASSARPDLAAQRRDTLAHRDRDLLHVDDDRLAI